MGYDWVPGALAGALALEEAGEDAVARRRRLLLARRGRRAAPGTKESLVGAMLDPGHAFRDGRSCRAGAARVRAFEVPGAERPAISVGSAEHFTLRRPTRSCARSTPTWAGSGRSRAPCRPARWRRPDADAARRADGDAGTGERLVGAAADAPADRRGSTTSWIAAAAYDAGGTQLSEVHLTAPTATTSRRASSPGRPAAPRARRLGNGRARPGRRLRAGRARARAAGLAEAVPAPADGGPPARRRRTHADVRLPHPAPRAAPARHSRRGLRLLRRRRQPRGDHAAVARFAIVTPRPIEMGPGTPIEYRLRLHGIPIRG